MSIGFVIGIGILNLVMVLVISPLFEGFARKLRAIMHSRIGPPIIQPYYDLIKLSRKEDLQSSNNWLVRYTPYVCLASVVIAALLIPMGAFNVSTHTYEAPLSKYGDSILFIYFIGLSAVAIMGTATASGNPFAFIGASREMMMYLTVEPVLVITLMTAAINAQSFNFGNMLLWNHDNGPKASMIVAAVFLFCTLQAQVGKIPFDIPEAEQEIAGGLYIEQSGPKYAVLRWSMMAKQFVFCSLFCQLFIPWPIMRNLPLDVLINMGKVFILVLVICLIDVLNPRLRIDQSVKLYLYLTLFSLSAIVLAVAGL